MSKLIEKIKGNKLLTLVILIYLTLAAVMPEKALLSLKNSLYYVKEMLIIMPVIMLLTALIEAWVPKKAIENTLGQNSGAKGPIFSFLLGSFSAGPIYAAFPLSKMLLAKGASIANIAIILSTWAVVKVPMLANEAKFLGPKFMMIRWVLTSISIFIMAFIISRLVKKNDIPMDDVKQTANEDALQINETYCIGCGVCEKYAPKYFTLENKKAKIIHSNVSSEDMEAINETVKKCPVNVIKYNISSTI